MVDAAYIALRLALLNEEAGNKDLFHPQRDDSWLRELFEKAVLGFYKIKLRESRWKVGARNYGWPLENGKHTAGITALLPQMKTDIVLERQAERIIMDTKFTHILQKGQYGERFKSGYLYQIYAYVRSQEKAEVKNSYGLLLHPAIDEEIDELMELQGHVIRLATLDLAADAKTIRDRLLELADTKQWQSRLKGA